MASVVHVIIAVTLWSSCICLQARPQQLNYVVALHCRCASSPACTHPPAQLINTVPSWSVPVISTCGPAAVLAAYFLLNRAHLTRLEVHNTLLGCLACVAATALATNLVKLSVRRLQSVFSQQACV